MLAYSNYKLILVLTFTFLVLCGGVFDPYQVAVSVMDRHKRRVPIWVLANQRNRENPPYTYLGDTSTSNQLNGGQNHHNSFQSQLKEENGNGFGNHNRRPNSGDFRSFGEVNSLPPNDGYQSYYSEDAQHWEATGGLDHEATDDPVWDASGDTHWVNSDDSQWENVHQDAAEQHGNTNHSPDGGIQPQRRLPYELYKFSGSFRNGDQWPYVVYQPYDIPDDSKAKAAGSYLTSAIKKVEKFGSKVKDWFTNRKTDDEESDEELEAPKVIPGTFKDDWNHKEVHPPIHNHSPTKTIKKAEYNKEFSIDNGRYAWPHARRQRRDQYALLMTN